MSVINVDSKTTSRDFKNVEMSSLGEPASKTHASTQDEPTPSPGGPIARAKSEPGQAQELVTRLSGVDNVFDKSMGVLIVSKSWCAFCKDAIDLFTRVMGKFWHALNNSVAVMANTPAGQGAL